MLILAIGGVLVGLSIKGASLTLLLGSIDDKLDEHGRGTGCM
jgi:hypothetical protein